MNWRTLFPLTWILILLASCAGVHERREKADKLATTAGFRKVIIDTQSFKLLSYQRIKQPGTTAVIYIEGDGLAFVQRNQVSLDPTPVDPVGLKLAVLDMSANVIYFARPCQYIPAAENPECSYKFWTIARYAPVVIQAMNQAIEHEKHKYNFHGIRLVGYSGGATVAAILAASRSDIIDLRTMAGNLDTAAFARDHEVTPLSGSLNPTDYAAELVHVPQVHLIGKGDNVVTDAVTESYVSALSKYDPYLCCVEIRKFKGVTHNYGWVETWKRYALLAGKCK